MTSDPHAAPSSSLISGRRTRLFKVYRVTARVLMGYGALTVFGIFRRAESRDRALSRYLRASSRWVRRTILEEFVLGEDRDWMGLLTQTVKDLALSVLTVPDDLKRLLTQARRGEARLEVRGLREGASLLYALGHQLLYGGLALGTGALAYVAETRGDDAYVMPLASTAAFFVLCLGGSMLRARKWQKELRRRRQ